MYSTASNVKNILVNMAAANFSRSPRAASGLRCNAAARGLRYRRVRGKTKPGWGPWGSQQQYVLATAIVACRGERHEWGACEWRVWRSCGGFLRRQGDGRHRKTTVGAEVSWIIKNWLCTVKLEDTLGFRTGWERGRSRAGLTRFSVHARAKSSETQKRGHFHFMT